MIESLLKNLKIESLNEMQRVAIDAANEKDTIILSPTGSGKTIAFLIPLLKRLRFQDKGVQALVLVPSRELALQIEQVFRAMATGFKVNSLYGGHSVRVEKNNLTQAPTLIIGTPGRIAFHIRNGNFDSNSVHSIVLDEFDKSLEFGFEEDMSFIISSFRNLERRILTSATPMDKIPDFTGLKDATLIDFLEDSNSSPDFILRAIFANAADKLEALFSLICKIGNHSSLVFCNHREAAERVSVFFEEIGLDHGLFHGGMEQEDREKALIKFRNGTSRILVCTDLAARGLDIPEIEFVIHYQLAPTKEAFLHRNGRTARMKASGKVYVIITQDEKPSYLNDLEFETLPENPILPENTVWSTLYLGAGRKDKINKIDIVGFLIKKANLDKEDIGLIEVQDFVSYAAVKKNKLAGILTILKNEKIKNKKVKVEISR